MAPTPETTVTVRLVRSFSALYVNFGQKFGTEATRLPVQGELWSPGLFLITPEILGFSSPRSVALTENGLTRWVGLGPAFEINWVGWRFSRGH